MGIKDTGGIWKLPDDREVLPKSMARRIMQQLHDQTHWGTQASVDQFTIKYMCIGIYDIAKQVVRGCITCQRVNRHQVRERTPGGRELAHRPFSHVQIDFTELPKVGRYKYLLVLVDHLTHFVEAHPTSWATANVVIKTLLEEIIPRYGIVEILDSDRGPHFANKVMREVTMALGTK